jgi:hypothetical protein
MRRLLASAMLVTTLCVILSTGRATRPVVLRLVDSPPFALVIDERSSAKPR